MGHLLALKGTAADPGDREPVDLLAEQVQQGSGSTVKLAYFHQGYTGAKAAEAAQQHGIRLEVVKHPMAKRGFVLLPCRWVVERGFAWAARFSRLAHQAVKLHRIETPRPRLLRSNPYPTNRPRGNSSAEPVHPF